LLHLNKAKDVNTKNEDTVVIDKYIDDCKSKTVKEEPKNEEEVKKEIEIIINKEDEKKNESPVHENKKTNSKFDKLKDLVDKDVKQEKKMEDTEIKKRKGHCC